MELNSRVLSRKTQRLVGSDSVLRSISAKLASQHHATSEHKPSPREENKNNSHCAQKRSFFVAFDLRCDLVHRGPKVAAPLAKEHPRGRQWRYEIFTVCTRFAFINDSPIRRQITGFFHLNHFRPVGRSRTAKYGSRIPLLRTRTLKQADDGSRGARRHRRRG